MKKLLSLVLTFLIIFSCLSITVAKAEALSEKLADTSDFSLSSIEYTEQMLVGYNIGNCFEMTELRNQYVRPTINSIDEHIVYKETMAGNVPVTEEYIKYLKSVGVQAIRLPITWFNMLEDENGNIYHKNTWYSDIETRKKAWYNGKINEEFLARVKQVVDWIIENDMYCMINTHHDGAANTSNAVNPIKMEEAYKEQTYNYLTNIWTQVGEYFKDYGSKLMFEFYNEATANTGHMTANSTTDAFVSELLCHLIPLIRNQGSNNANRFLVCPRYGGVSYWLDDEHFAKFRAADTAEDKIIITTHTYTSSGQMYDAVKSVRTRMNKCGVGAIVDEIGPSYASNLSEEMVKTNTAIRTASDEYKVCCFWWDGGLVESSLTNRYYSCASSLGLGAYVGKEIPVQTFTKSEIVAKGAASNQPNWIELCTPEFKSSFGKKYTIITTESKIKTLNNASGTKGRGFYTLNCEEEGLTTYYVSDDGVNYSIVSTVIPTNWCKVAWDEFNVGGTTYYTQQIDGNYQIQKIGDGLQEYSVSGQNLLPLGGNWRTGVYSAGGNYIEDSNMRICLENKIPVKPNSYYQFYLTTGSRYVFILRCYDENGNYVSNLGTVANGNVKVPDNAHFISVSLYDTHQTQNADTLFAYLEDETFKPTMYLFEVGGVKTDIAMQTVKGSSIRLNEKTGLRFYTEIDQEAVTALREKGYTVELGTLITPYDYLNDKELTFDMGEGMFVDVKYESNNYYSDGNGFEGIIGSIVNIKEENICRDFVARGYAKITGEYGQTDIVYADYDKTKARSLGYVSYMLKNDTAEFSKDFYKDFTERVNSWAKKFEKMFDPEADDRW